MTLSTVSSLTQGVGFAGMAVFSWQDPVGLHNVSVSLLPTLTRMVNPQPAPLQKVNMAIGGQIFIFQYSSRDLLTWPIEIIDLPYDNQAARFIGRSTDCFVDLQSFIQVTINYTEKPFTFMTPDGQIQTVRYLKGIDTFREAAGNTNRAQFWTGQLIVTRVIS